MGALIGLGVLLVGAAIVIAYLLGTRGNGSTAAAIPDVVSAKPTSEVSAPTVTATTPPPSIVTTPSATAKATPSATATVKPLPPPPTVAKPAINCNPPWTIDKQGHKHFIPECN